MKIQTHMRKGVRKASDTEQKPGRPSRFFSLSLRFFSFLLHHLPRSIGRHCRLPPVRPCLSFLSFSPAFPTPLYFPPVFYALKEVENARCIFPLNLQRCNFWLASTVLPVHLFKVLLHLLPPPLILFLPRSSSSPFPPHALLPMWRILGGGMLLLLLFSSYLPV